MEKSDNATWSCSIFVDCPYCGEQQDLIEHDGDPRINYNIKVGEHGTKRTKNLEVTCLDCEKEFIVPGLESG